MHWDRCQLESPVYRNDVARLVRLPREHIRQRFGPPVTLGRASRFAEGDWVRVRDPDAIRATLDEQSRLRGLLFTPEQWSFCRRTYRVERVVRRMLDDHLRMRRIARTTTLAGVTCAGLDGSGGCGRECALFFRDEWLEPSVAAAADEAQPFAQYARVRPLADILATLGRDGRLLGVRFTKGMEQYAGQSIPVRAVVRSVRGLPAWKWLRAPGQWYILDGVRCRGEPFGEAGPCHRQCGLLWHRSWLELRPQ